MFLSPIFVAIVAYGKSNTIEHGITSFIFVISIEITVCFIVVY